MSLPFPPRRLTWPLLCPVLLVLLVLAGACSEDGGQGQEYGVPVIRLVENPWLASRLDNAVAGFLLEEHLGCRVVSVPMGGFEQFPALEAGEVHASLEVWPSGRERCFQQYAVEDGGPLGAAGRIGWFMPAYMLEAHPELATWQGLRGPKAAALFRTSKTGSKGQFLTGDPSWVRYDEDIIRNLGLDFQEVFAGGEDALLKALEDAYANRRPLLFYFWSPHAAFVKYDLVEVQLPRHTPQCYASAEEGGVACAYPRDVFRKAFWPGLRDYAPKAHSLLSAMRLLNEDQVSMMAMVQIQGMAVEEAAKAWLEANPHVWRPWLP